MAPPLAAFRDQVTFLKHNLNAQAIASLETQVVSIETDVKKLVADMEASIAEADSFIKTLGAAAPDAIAEAFAGHGYTVHRAPSDWVVDRRARLFAAEIAAGHATAAMAQERRGLAAIADWAAVRRAQAMDGMLAVRIGHRDMLALPPG